MSRVVGYASWAPRAGTLAVLEQVETVLAEYRAQWPLTVRQVFYRLVGAHGFPKTEQDYKRLQDYLNRGRRAGRVPWQAIRDDGNSSADPRWLYTDLDPDEWFRTRLPTEYGYLLQPQIGQAEFTEVICEAGGMVPMLGGVVNDRGIPVFSGGGFDSVTRMHEHALRHLGREQPTRVLYLGDYDPSGMAMYARYEADITAFGSDANWEQVAVLPEHIAVHSLPTSPPKVGDKRSVFTDTRTVQAEALPPDVLLRLLTEAVDARWDPIAAEAVLDEQAEGRYRLRDLRDAVEELLADPSDNDESDD